MPGLFGMEVAKRNPSSESPLKDWPMNLIPISSGVFLGEQ